MCAVTRGASAEAVQALTEAVGIYAGLAAATPELYAEDLAKAQAALLSTRPARNLQLAEVAG